MRRKQLDSEILEHLFRERMPSTTASISLTWIVSLYHNGMKFYVNSWITFTHWENEDKNHLAFLDANSIFSANNVFYLVAQLYPPVVFDEQGLPFLEVDSSYSPHATIVMLDELLTLRPMAQVGMVMSGTTSTIRFVPQQ